MMKKEKREGSKRDKKREEKEMKEEDEDGEEPWWRGRRMETAFARYGHRTDPPGKGGGIPWIHPEIREAARRCKCNQEGLN